MTSSHCDPREGLEKHARLEFLRQIMIMIMKIMRLSIRKASSSPGIFDHFASLGSVGILNFAWSRWFRIHGRVVSDLLIKRAFTNFAVFSKLCIPQIATFVFGEGHLDVKFGARVGHLAERLFGPVGLEFANFQISGIGLGDVQLIGTLQPGIFI